MKIEAMSRRQGKSYQRKMMIKAVGAGAFGNERVAFVDAGGGFYLKRKGIAVVRTPFDRKGLVGVTLKEFPLP